MKFTLQYTPTDFKCDFFIGHLPYATYEADKKELISFVHTSYNEIGLPDCKNGRLICWDTNIKHELDALANPTYTFPLDNSAELNSEVDFSTNEWTMQESLWILNNFKTSFTKNHYEGTKEQYFGGLHIFYWPHKKSNPRENKFLIKTDVLLNSKTVEKFCSEDNGWNTLGGIFADLKDCCQSDPDFFCKSLLRLIETKSCKLLQESTAYKLVSTKLGPGKNVCAAASAIQRDQSHGDSLLLTELFMTTLEEENKLLNISKNRLQPTMSTDNNNYVYDVMWANKYLQDRFVEGSFEVIELKSMDWWGGTTGNHLSDHHMIKATFKAELK